jgi:hypothetical protein
MLPDAKPPLSSTTIKILARRTNRSTFEVEKSWRRAKQFVRDAGDKGNYLRAFKVVCEMLKIDTQKFPEVGDKLVLDNVEAVVVTSMPGFVLLETKVDDKGTVMLFPLTGLLDFI